MNATVLVIGGAGYIGSHVTHELCDQGYSVVILDNLSTGFSENIDKRADFIKSSFTNKNVLEKILKKIDCVIHLAALKAAGESMENPEKYSKHNINNSIDLINLCIKHNVKKFIFSSTAAVYGAPEYLPVDENHPLNPINYYGFTKYVIEKQLSWYNQIKGLNIAFLRYFNAAGYDIRGRITKKEKNPQNLLPIIMEVANGDKKSLNVYGNDYNTSDGTCLRDYIHVNDLAVGHLKALEKLSYEDKIITNLATGKANSVLKVIKTTEQITGKKIKFNFTDRRIGDPESLYSTSKNAKDLLNWEPKFSDLKTIIKSMWNIYKK